MPEDEKESAQKPPRIWITSPDGKVLALVEAIPETKTYKARIEDNEDSGQWLDIVIGSPEIASALARCLLLAVTDEHVPQHSIRTSTMTGLEYYRGRPIRESPSP